MPGETVLVVDDAPPNVKLLRLILKDAGYEVLEAANGAEALDVVHRERPAAVILDVRMPGLSGYEVCARLRAEPEYRAIPVIMVTALSMPEERIKGIEAGATDFITKPFNKRELLARLAASLDLTRGGPACAPLALKEPVMLADPDWRLIDASAAAADYLGLIPGAVPGFDFGDLLRHHALAPPADGDAWDFQLQTRNRVAGVAGRATVVKAPDGRPVLRVIVLREEPVQLA